MIEDCIRYDLNSYTTDGSTTLNYALPSTFKVEYEEYVTQVADNSCYMGIGESSSRAVLFGKVTRASSIHTARVRTNASGSGDVNYNGDTIALDGWHSVFVTFNGTTFNFNDELSITDFNTVSLSSITHLGFSKSVNSGGIRNIKIKQL